MELHNLTKTQQKTLDLISNSGLASSFYFTGGTALSSAYLNHRDSEDLDFFSEEEVDTENVLFILHGFKSELEFDSIEVQTSFNRNLFFLHFEDGQSLKTEFTYYPFPQIEQGPQYGKIRIDSLVDIATNKLHTISVKNRSRDFIDLYFIFQKREFSIKELYFYAKQKFDTHIDPLQLGAQLVSFEPTDLKLVLKPIQENQIRIFFENQAKEFGNAVLTKKR